MMKIIKVGGIFIVGGAVVIGIYLGLLFYPGVLFAHSIDYKNFSVYYQDEVVPELVYRVLDDVDAALRGSEINDPTLTHSILLGHNNKAFKVVQDIAWRIGPHKGKPLTYNRAAPPRISQIISFRVPDFEQDLLVHPEVGLDMGMTYDLTHEAMHSVVSAELGVKRAMSLPSWKREGYPEYVAASLHVISDSSYQLSNSVKRMLTTDLSRIMDRGGDLDTKRLGCQSRSTIQDEAGNWRLTCYYISRVLVEYLLDYKDVTVDELMSPRVSGTETFRGLLAAYEAGQLGG